MSGQAIVRPASSDFWKAPLVNIEDSNANKKETANRKKKGENANKKRENAKKERKTKRA